MKAKEVKDQLNGMCEGLGDAWLDNLDDYRKNYKYGSLYHAVVTGFIWYFSPEGLLWGDIAQIISEMNLH